MNVMTPERFWSKTERRGDCLIWCGKSRIGPYGTVHYERKQWLAHRLAYYLANGSINDTDVIRHACDTPLCVEPAHLSAGTHADNVADKVNRKRHRFHENHPMSKLTSVQVEDIRRRYAAGNVMQKDLAQEYGIQRSQLSRIINGKRWS